jgi:diguanylate cyclase (GGDEF)-like protein
MRKELEQWTWLGVALNVVLAVILMRVLGAGIVNRIKLLTANSKLLAEGKPLRDTVSDGNDEISVLDRTFRSMARDLHEAIEREAIFARMDYLSGLQNRRAFYETLQHFVALGRRSNANISLLICDIDHFKAVNDRFGHGVGDEAIKAVADAIQAVVRKSDFAARWGGEEFIIGMPNTNNDGAAALAERLRVAVANISLPSTAGPVRFTVSVGVAVMDEAEDIDQCIQRADGALYRAKNLGRDRVRVAESEGTLRLPRMVPPA